MIVNKTNFDVYVIFVFVLTPVNYVKSFLKICNFSSVINFMKKVLFSLRETSCVINQSVFIQHNISVIGYYISAKVST